VLKESVDHEGLNEAGLAFISATRKRAEEPDGKDQAM
jgi:hypothetical protein